MTVLAEPAVSVRPKGVLVTAPVLKFVIGFTASICAVLFPRLIAMLTTTDSAKITFFSGEYLLVALILSALVGVVVMILEWRVPRAPRDTFMTTLGLPAILAGALSANQNTATLQDAMKAQDALAAALASKSGISIESTPASAEPGKQGQLIDLLVTPVYAQASRPTMMAAQSRPLAIVIDQAKCLIVLDRAPTQQAAQAKAAQLNQQLQRTAPTHPMTVEVQKQGNEYLVVAPGGARTKSDAVLEAVRIKDTYHVTPTLLEVPKTD